MMPPKKQNKKSSGTRIFIFLRALLEKNGSVNSVTVLVLSIHQFTAAAKKRRSFSNEDPCRYGLEGSGPGGIESG